MENKEIHGYVYLITNKINGKQYTGQTTETIEIRFNKHCSSAKTGKDSYMAILRAIKKYGRENFIIQELAVAHNQEELTFLEGLYMSWFNTLAPNGYNLTKIINGKGKHSEESKEKMRKIANQSERLKLSSELGKKRRGKSYDNSSSGYIGVYIQGSKYISSICFNNKNIYLGNYNVETDAAKAYDIAAIKYFGEDTTLNFNELRQYYIDDKITVNKNSSKSGIKNIHFYNSRNRWVINYFNKILNKNSTKTFKTLEDAIKFKITIEKENNASI